MTRQAARPRRQRAAPPTELHVLTLYGSTLVPASGNVNKTTESVRPYGFTGVGLKDAKTNFVGRGGITSKICVWPRLGRTCNGLKFQEERMNFRYPLKCFWLGL